MNRLYYLPNIGDYRKSFYGKAQVLEDENGTHLLSYGNNICTIKGTNVSIHTDVSKWDSPTSLRHIKSFLRFFGFLSGNKKELIEMYCKN